MSLRLARRCMSAIHTSRIIIRMNAIAAAKCRLGNVEGAYRRDQHHRDAGEHARQAQRPDDAAQHARAVAAEVARGFDELHVHLRHDRIYRDYHIRKIVIHHADNNGGFGADDVHRAEAERGEETVKDAGVLKDRHPCVGTDKEVHPHGDHDERDHYLLRPCLGTRHYIGDGVAHQEAYKRRDNGKLQ